jgi:hypothetical protein
MQMFIKYSRKQYNTVDFQHSGTTKTGTARLSGSSGTATDSIVSAIVASFFQTFTITSTFIHL